MKSKLPSAGLVLLAAAMGAPGAEARRPSVPTRPNIIFIYADDLGKGMLSAYGQRQFTTAQIGKLEWGFTATRRQMAIHGWDYYYGYLDHVRCHGFYSPFLFESGQVVSIAGNTHKNCGKSIENETEATLRERWDRNGKAVYSQDLFLDKMLTFIRQHKDRPFFLFHPTQLPHGPVAVPAIHPELARNDKLTSIEKEYGSMVKLLDEHVGRLLEELRALGLERRTIVIFMADNGHEIYYSQKGRCEKPYRDQTTGLLFDDVERKYYSHLEGDIFNGNAGMEGLKRSNLDGGAHVPLTFYGPGIIPAGKRRSDLVAGYDLLPTLAELLGVALPVRKDGISFLSTLMQGKRLSPSRYVVYGSNLGPAIVTNEGRKLRYCRRQNLFELYHLPSDPQERNNVMKSHPERARELQQILLKACGGNWDNGINRYG